MSSLTDTRKTILQIVNETRKKLGYAEAASLTSDAQSRVLVDYLNDVISEISDFGDWQEMLSEVNILASASVRRYTVSATSPVKSIREIAFQGLIPPLRRRSIEELRLWERTGGRGSPRNYTVKGVNPATGNPYIEVYPMPTTAQNNMAFNVLYYAKPAQYTTSTSSDTLIDFPARLVVKGLHAAAYKDETSMQQDYAIVRGEFIQDLTETYNRYNGDTGSTTYFTPGGRRSKG